MQLIQKNNRFETVATYDERMLPKNAGFHWDPAKKTWWIDRAEKAEILIKYATDEAKMAIETALKKTKTAIEKSRAVDTDINIPAPEGLAYLPYQKAGIAYAQNKNHVLIGDEMGLGKTIQAIGLLNTMPMAKNILIVCPASLRINWFREMEKWMVMKKPIRILKSKQAILEGVNIVNYDILGKIDVKNIEFDLIIFDESHFLKNPKAARTKAGLALQGTKKVYLSGTPIMNRPIELFSILKNAGIMQSWKYYVKRFCDGTQTRWGWDTSGASNTDELQNCLREKFMVRRLKKDVLKELPAKRRQVIELPANGCTKVVQTEQKAWKLQEDKIIQLKTAVEFAKISDNEQDYQNAVENLKTGVRESFTEMSRIRKETAVAKIPYVAEHVKNMIEEEIGSVIIFAHHHDVIDGLKKEFPDSLVLTGRENQTQKQKAVDDFQAGKAKIFIGSIKAAGVGITLTKSSTVVFAELDWVPANITQAEDRTHRIGQQNSVLIQHLVLEGSLDAIMAKTITEKQAILDAVLDNHHEEKKIIEIEEPVIPIKSISPRKKQLNDIAEKLTDEEILKIHQNLKTLSSYCDGAATIDGIGFNKIDTHIGKQLAAFENLTKKQAALGKILTTKYKKQLEQ